MNRTNIEQRNALDRCLVERKVPQFLLFGISKRVAHAPQAMLDWLAAHPDATAEEMRIRSYEIDGTPTDRFRARNPLFWPLTAYIPRVEEQTASGVWTGPVDPWYSETADKVMRALYEIFESQPMYRHIADEYIPLLEIRGLQWSGSAMQNADAAALDAEGILALLTGISNAERFCAGTLVCFFHRGIVLRWLKRLEELDRAEGCER